MGRLDDGRYIVVNVKHEQVGPNVVRTIMRNTAEIDRAKYKHVNITFPQDPGQAGVDQAASLIKMLSGFPVEAVRPTGDKVTRAEPFSAQWQAGNVMLLAGEWNETYLTEMEGFPESVHDDMVDASSDAFTRLQRITDWGGLTS